MAFKPIQILINAKDNASSVFDKLQAKVMAVGAVILSYFGIQAFAGAVSGAADMEAAMSRLRAVTQGSAEEMAALRKAADDASLSTMFSNAEAAAGLEELAKAGLNVQESIGALPGVMAVAEKDGLGLAETAGFITKAVAGMNLEFSESGRVADVLASGADSAQTSVAGLGQALSYAAPTAVSANLSLESTVAILAKLSDGGIDASRSGTALANMLAQFSDPASKFRNELALAGITTNNFEKALHELAESGQRGEKAILAVGLNAGPALRALLNKGMPALDELTGKLRNSEGAAAAAAAAVRDNLNGSLSGLAGVWSQVKDKLSTPVLPVLREGVEDLIQVFRSALADGTISRFGESIATAFSKGIQFTRDFIATVDMGAVIARLQEFADRANEALTKVGVYATNAGNTVKLAYGVMTAGVNGVLTAIYGIGSVFAEVAEAVMKGVALLREGLSKVTFGELSESFKLAADDARSMAQGFGDAAQAMRDKAAQALEEMADSAQTARNGFAGLIGATDDAKESTDKWAEAVANAAAEIERQGKVQAEAAAKARAAAKSAEDQAIAAKEARDALASLRAEYEAAVAAGNWQRAAELQEQVNASLRGAKGAARDAADAVAQVEAAFSRLGVTSTAALKRQAASAAADYETIKKSGTATAEDLSAAFKKAAEDAIAANKGVAPAWVIAEAGVRGYKLAVDEAGRATLEAVNRSTPGLERMARGWHMNREAIEAQQDAMAKLLMSYTMSANYSERQIALLEREAAAAEKVAEAYRKKWNIDKDGFTLDANGRRMEQSAPSERYVYDTAKAQGLTDEQALALLEEFMPNGKASRGNNGNTGLGASKDWFTLVNEAINRAVIEAARNRVNGTGPAAPPAPTTTTTTSSGSAGQRERGSTGGVTLQINLHPGVDLSNRAEAERMARQLMPAIENLNRRGMRS